MNLCEHCGKPFQQNTGRGRKRHYCSDHCRKVAHRERDYLLAAPQPMQAAPSPPDMPPLDQAARCIAEARGVADAALALSPKLPPNVSWRIESMGSRFHAALDDLFGI